MLTDLWSDLRYRLRALVDRDALERELDDELHFHLALEAERHERSGLSRDDAWRRARAEFGRLDRVKEASRRARGTAALETVLHDLRVAARRLRRAPGFVATAVLVLALGVGATTAAFGVVDAVLLAPLPYPQPDRLVRLTHAMPGVATETRDQSDATVLLYQREAATSFDGIAAWIADNVDANLEPSSPDQTPRRAHVARVTANLLDVLRVRPALGRGFVPGDDRAGAPRVVLVSDRLWRERYHADPRVIGRQMLVNAVPRTIVGVMPPRFAYPAPTVDVWIPTTLDPARTNAERFDLVGVGRLRDGVTPDRARADLARALARLPDAFAGDRAVAPVARAHLVPQVTPLRDAMVAPVAPVLWMVLASVSLVLVVACVNVATLFLVRAEHAQVELAVRGALGSSVRGLMTQSLVEAVVLSALGGGLGALLAGAALRAVRAGGAWSLPRLHEVGVDPRTLAFALGATALCAVAVSLLPLLRARRVSIAGVLRAAGRGPGVDASRQHVRDALVVAQTALALVLVASSGLMARSLTQLENVSPGFVADDVAIARVVLPFARYGRGASRAQVLQGVLETLRATPGVRDAAVTNWVPLTADAWSETIALEDRPAASEAVDATHPVVTVDGRYFATAGIPLRRGRTFGPMDPARPSEEAIVSRAFARRHWSGASPIGKRLRVVGGTWYTIVGEADDVHYRTLDARVDAVVYLPMVRRDGAAPAVPWNVAVLARTQPGRAAATVAAIRGAIRSQDPALPTFGEGTLDETVRRASARTRALVVLLAAASAIALTLGAVGLYGIVAYGVTVRRRELGVRLALGASPAALGRAVTVAGLRLAAVGIAIGLPCAMAFTRLLRGLLYEVSPSDPWVLGATAVVLLAVAGVASWLPARRTAAIGPAEVLGST